MAGRSAAGDGHPSAIWTRGSIHAGYHNSFIRFFIRMPAPDHRYRVTVLVLGDLGRSPRMLNHAIALAEDGAAVSLAGYDETPLDRAASENPRIHVYRIHPLRRAAEGTGRVWFLLVSACRAGALGFELLWLLLVRTPRPYAVLVQNPPTLPTMLIGWIAARIRGAFFIVDWHNFGYSMLVPRLGSSHWVVRMARIWERWLGRRADAHFCVSSAMREVLMKAFGLRAPVVLYDVPRNVPAFLPISKRSAAARMILERNGQEIPDGAALAVCPTSWTADEDMDLLLQGLRLWDTQGDTHAPGPRLMVLITGRGPQRESFEERLGDIRWRRVIVQTAFFDPADYRAVLGAAHFGFSLHRSSSGVDLPMKIMDLFGARTPVCALDYGACLAEQIQPGRTALTFRDSHELAAGVEDLIGGFPDDLQRLEEMQQNINASFSETWSQAWQREAAPVFQRMRASRPPGSV